MHQIAIPHNETVKWCFSSLTAASARFGQGVPGPVATGFDILPIGFHS